MGICCFPDNRVVLFNTSENCVGIYSHSGPHMRIGIFGGTFDPPHTGHLIVAEYVCESLQLDRVIFVPASIPPHKESQHHSSGIHRLEMVTRAIEGNFEVSDVEIRRGGVSYTVETLEYFTAQHAGASLYMMIGMDNLREFHTWKSPERIVQLAYILAMTRPGYQVKEQGMIPPDRLVLCNVPDIQLSSSEIRERIHLGLTVRYMLPPAVEKYISHHDLYRDNAGGVRGTI